ncbi:MAG TPA: metal-dependent hydrolase [Gemmatimonadales bacterium]|nr:metal-dependent hydrolase [Gemmatimonadales bacterium]
MPTPISHAAVGFAIAAWTQPGMATRRVCIVAAACAALPDIDVIGWPLHIPQTSLFGHRAITHSLAFALVAAVLAAIVFFRGDQWTRGRARIALILGLALVSHACLDALSTYSVGVEFFAPFSQQRFRFPWTPLGAPHGVVGQIVQEPSVVLLPALVAAWLGIKVKAR